MDRRREAASAVPRDQFGRREETVADEVLLPWDDPWIDLGGEGGAAA